MTESNDVFTEVDEDQFRARLAKRFEAAEALLRFAWAKLPPEEHPFDDAFTMIVAVFARSTYTYRGVLRLCGLGYAPQADMLCRSLFEDMVTAHWASLPAHRDEVVARNSQAQHDHNRLLLNDIAKKHDWLVDVVADAADLEERRDELTSMFGPTGTSPGRDPTLYKLVEEVEELWPDEAGKRYLWGAFDAGHRSNNQAVHTTAAAISRGARVVSTHEDGSSISSFQAGPIEDEDGASAALWGRNGPTPRWSGCY